jgi:hypothetical protein
LSLFSIFPNWREWLFHGKKKLTCQTESTKKGLQEGTYKKITTGNPTDRCREAGMAVIQIDRLSLPDAEEVIAEIWNCLEEYGIPSPTMNVDFHANARVTMGLTFDEPIGAQLVSLRLESWMRNSVELHSPIARDSARRAEMAPTSCGPELAPGFILRAAAPLVPAEPFRRAKRR